MNNAGIGFIVAQSWFSVKSEVVAGWVPLSGELALAACEGSGFHPSLSRGELWQSGCRYILLAITVPLYS